MRYLKQLIFCLAIVFSAISMLPIGLNLSYSDILIALLFVGSPIKIIQSALLHSTYKNFSLIFAFFILVSLFVGIFSYDPQKHVTGVAQYFFSWFIFTPVLLYYAKDNIKLLIIPYIVGALCSLILLFLFYSFDITLFSDIVEYKVTGSPTRYSIGATNDFGFVQATAIVFSIVALTFSSGWKRLYYIPLILLFIPSLVLTGSRSGLMLVVVFVLFATVLNKNQNIVKYFSNYLKIFTSILFLAVGLYLFQDNAYLSNLTRILNIFDISDRLNHIMIGAEMLSENPFAIGMGINSYQSLVGMMPLHNVFAIIAVELGILGLFSFMLCWAIMIFESYVARKHHGQIPVALILSVFVYIQSITHIYDRMFWVTICLALILYYPYKRMKGFNKVHK